MSSANYSEYDKNWTRWIAGAKHVRFFESKDVGVGPVISPGRVQTGQGVIRSTGDVCDTRKCYRILYACPKTSRCFQCGTITDFCYERYEATR